MKTKELLRKLNGIQTIESIMDLLKLDKKQAVYYIHKLRKYGYVKTKRLSNNKRVYNISLDNKLGARSYFDIINENSPIKITTSIIYKIYGKEPSLEETLVYAIKTKSLRIILASIALFRKINNWLKLFRLAKENHVEREVGVLYDLSKELMKVRSMTKRFRNRTLPKKDCKFNYLVEGLRSKDFKEIEERWKIYLPFNKKDLEEYK